MIIIEGPDHTGKSTLAKKLLELNTSLSYYHFTQHSKYTDYIEDLASLKMLSAVLDRHIISEIPYSEVMNRKAQYSVKEYHNVIMMSLALNPLIIYGCSHPKEEEYAADQYMPYSEWSLCHTKYLYYLRSQSIDFMEYDYRSSQGQGDDFAKNILKLHKLSLKSIEWAIPMWQNGMGYTGSSHPDVLVVAERIGPSNSHNIPFEQGPTGFMISEVIHDTNTPLGKIAITNLVKIPSTISRTSAEYDRQPNESDLQLFEVELQHLNPKLVLFMGSISRKAGMAVCDKLSVKHESIIHLGALNHQGIKDLANYKKTWKLLIDKYITYGEGTPAGQSAIKRVRLS